MTSDALHRRPSSPMVVVEGREGSRCDRADDRIEVIDGLTSSARRKEIEVGSTQILAKDPLRILLATDGTRERLNFQVHCADLFHFDLPWIPGRIEQRNGRIDRKQPVPEVTRHYFVLPQRVEDRVIDVGQETETIEHRLAKASAIMTLSAGLIIAVSRAAP